MRQAGVDVEHWWHHSSIVADDAGMYADSHPADCEAWRYLVMFLQGEGQHFQKHSTNF